MKKTKIKRGWDWPNLKRKRKENNLKISLLQINFKVIFLLQRLWSGFYNFASSYNYPATYSDGTPVASTDLKAEAFPDYNYGNANANFRYRCVTQIPLSTAF